MGLDLATINGRTGKCLLNWTADHACVKQLSVGCRSDEELVEDLQHVLAKDGWVGIDAPFGFPMAFNKAVNDWSTTRRLAASASGRPSWLGDKEAWDPINRRLTDAVVHLRLAAAKAAAKEKSDNATWPMSPVVERITPTVIRCARLLTQVSGSTAVDRVGSTTHIVEVYPIAALRLWAVKTRGYKKRGDGGSEPRKQVVDRLDKEEWLCLKDYKDKFAESDDAIDALVAALMARLAAHPRRPTGPAADIEKTVESEGWIHLPPPEGPLSRLSDLAPNSKPWAASGNGC